jgi:hypothetical protein
VLLETNSRLGTRQSSPSVVIWSPPVIVMPWQGMPAFRISSTIAIPTPV